MRRRAARPLVAVLAAVLLAPAASSELYLLSGGRLVSRATGNAIALRGVLEIRPRSARPFPRSVERFALETAAGPLGRSSLLYEDLQSGFGLIGTDALQISGHRFHRLTLRTDAQSIEGHADADGALYQQFQLDSVSGSVARVDARTGLPARLRVQGTLTRRRFAPACTALPEPRIPLEAGETIRLGGAGHIGIGAGLEIVALPGDGDLRTRAGRIEIADAPELGIEVAELEILPTLEPDVRFETSVTITLHAAGPPTLAELGMEAPQGATVEVLAGDELRVRAAGELIVASGVLAIGPYARLVLEAAGLLAIEEIGIELASPASLTLRAPRIEAHGPVHVAAGELRIETDAIEAPDRGPGAAPPIGGAGPVALCARARVLPDGIEVIGDFELEAQRVQPLEISAGRGGSVEIGRRSQEVVVLMGSPRVDLRQLDRGSVRIGPARAPARTGPGIARKARLRDVNRDGSLDLMLRFRPSRAGIGLLDDSICVTGTLRNGDPVLGCADVEVWQRPGRRRR